MKLDAEFWRAVLVQVVAGVVLYIVLKKALK